MTTKITQKKNGKKLEFNLIHNYRCKEPKLNISKLNIAIYFKKTYHYKVEFRNVRMIQHQKI